MADYAKISALDRLDTIERNGDLIPIVDVSTGKTKVITPGDMLDGVLNDIGIPGEIGFGVGIVPAAYIPSTLEELPGTKYRGSDQYGNYAVKIDGSIMCYIPRFYFKITHLQVSNLTGDGTKVTVVFGATHNLYAGEYVYLEGATGFALPKGRYLIADIVNTTTIKVSSSYNAGTYTAGSCFAFNSIQVKGDLTFTSEAEANAKGYALHRAFIDGGSVKRGLFIDKYKWSLTNYIDGTAGIASSVAFSNPISSSVDSKRTAGNPAHAGSFSNCKSNSQSPADIYGGAWAAAKSRGNDFAVTSIFVNAALSLLSLCHGQAAASATNCAWYSGTTANFPKGNNNSGADANDSSCTFQVCDDTYWAARNEARKNGSGNSLAKTTHNGQNCGVADLNGNQWEIQSGFTTGGYFSKNITGITRAAEAVFTIVGHGYSDGQIIQIQGADTAEWNTALQYKIFVVSDKTDDTFKLKYGSTYVNTSTLAADYDGTGLTCVTADFYLLKESVAIKNLTGSNSSATDNFCASGAPNANFLNLYTKITLPLVQNGYAMRFGNSTNQVLGMATTHNEAWLLGCAGLPKAVDSVSAAGSNQFGLDYYYEWLLQEMCPIRAGFWGNGSGAGVWYLYLGDHRSHTNRIVSARSCLYNV